MDRLEEAEKTIERLNSFIVDETIKNNSAMSYYNKALETHSKEDIMNAMQAVQQLEDGHMYKQALTKAVDAMAKIYNDEKVITPKGSIQPTAANEPVQPTMVQPAATNEPVEPTKVQPTATNEPTEPTKAATDTQNTTVESQINYEALERIHELETKIALNERNLQFINVFEKGLVDINRHKHKSFEERKNEIKLEIAKLEKEPDTLDIDQAYENYKESINNLINNVSTTNIGNVIAQLNAAITVPSEENINKALELASKLPDDSAEKQLIIKLALLTDAKYNKNRDEQEKNEFLQRLKGLNIEPLDLTNQEKKEKIEALNSKLLQVEKEETEAHEYATKLKEKIQKENAAMREEKREDLKEHMSKLESAANEGSITERTYEEITNKEKENKPQENSNSENIDTNEEIEEYDEFLDPSRIKEDKKTHIITAIKQAPAKLIEKIRNNNFKEKTKQVLDSFKENKISSTLALGKDLIAKLPIFKNNKNNESEKENDDELKNNEVIAQTLPENIENPIVKDEKTEKMIEEYKQEREMNNQQYNESLLADIENDLGGNYKVTLEDEPKAKAM